MRKALSLALLVALLASPSRAVGKDDPDFALSKNLDIFYSVYKELSMFYVDTPDAGKLIPAAIDAMLEELDPYTNYIAEKDKEEFTFQTTGEYGGVGSLITPSDTDLIMIKEVYAGTPSAKSGLHAGDRIVSINGESMRGKTVKDVSSRLRGEAGSQARLIVERPRSAKPLNIDITREVIKLGSVEYYGLVGDRTGLISVRAFETNCAEELKKAFLDLRDKQGAKRILIDLRNNPGGLLEEALQIVNFFVRSDSKLLSTLGRRKNQDRVYTAFRQPLDTVMPLGVIINRGSASASEIVAGALQDLDRAVVFGQRSFGKGLVQATREVAYDGYLKVTVAKYYTPSGRCIQALDYSHRDENGAVGYVPDSLIHEYHTAGGRTVYDGGGISPDVQLTPIKYKPVTYAVMAADFPFRYYLSQLERGATLAVDAEGRMTDAAYEDFVSWMVKQPSTLKYKTRTQEQLERVRKLAEAEDLLKDCGEALSALELKVKADLGRDLREASGELRPLIEAEWHLASGLRRAAIAHAAKSEAQLIEALATFEDDAKCRGLLDGSMASHAGDKVKRAEAKK